VRDRAEGATGQQVRLTLHPEARIEQDASGWILQRGSGFLRLEAEAAQISLEPAQVWETMGAGRPAPCAVLRGGDQLNWTLRSV
jgi:hypothetical protein